jgi:prefoldin subunit 5
MNRTKLNESSILDESRMKLAYENKIDKLKQKISSLEKEVTEYRQTLEKVKQKHG